jgi:hypothetical protein
MHLCFMATGMSGIEVIIQVGELIHFFDVY